MIHLLIPRWKIIKIFVKSLNGQTIVLEIDMNDTIRKLKHKIYEKEGIPIETQRLTFLANILEDDQTISYYNIQNESTLHLILRQPATAETCTPKYSDKKLNCNGRACYNCGNCRDWYFTGDVATWNWLRNWEDWNQSDKELWKKNENDVQNKLKRRDGSECLWIWNLHPPLHPWVNYGLPDHDPADSLPEYISAFIVLPTCNRGWIGHLGCMCRDNLNP